MVAGMGSSPSPQVEPSGHRFIRAVPVGLPPGGLHSIGADHCPEREPSSAWSADFQDALAVQRLSARWGMNVRRDVAKRILEPLTAPVEG